MAFPLASYHMCSRPEGKLNLDPPFMEKTNLASESIPEP